MSYRPQGGPQRPQQPPRGPREHQRAQSMPVPGRQGQQPGATRRQPQPPREQQGGTRQFPRDRAQPGQNRSGPARSSSGKSGSGKPKRRRIRFGRIALAIGLIFVLFVGAVWVYLEFSIQRTDALTNYAGRPPAAEGTNWLLVGSDARKGLSEQQRAKLNTGAAAGKRTDTIMIAHIPDNGVKPTLVSIPRDSLVHIPGRGTAKINAAFSWGGPSLLAKTVELATGLRIDHYVEIGFGGFANVVDAIGGVELTIPQRMHDTMTGVTIPAGHQTLNGAEALGFVRMRHSEATPRSDLDRIANQRKFIGAMADEIASVDTLLNPFQLFPLLSALPEAITMDSEDHLHNLIALGWAMRGIGSGGVVTTTVPVTSPSAKHWEPKSSEALFDALRNDTPVPESAIMH